MYLFIVGLLILLFLQGCGLEKESWFRNATGQGVAAEPIDMDLLSTDSLKKADAESEKGAKVAYVARIIADSEKKCNQFVNSLVLSELGYDTTFDIMTTVFSALGTAFTPLSTVHALTASSAIASGSKTAIDSDVYAKATISNFIQALQGTYYNDIGIYISKHLETPDPNLMPSLEVARIIPIHAECALAPAENAITNTLRGTPSAYGNSDGKSPGGSQAPQDEVPIPGHALR
jgi:hypothetical protein